ncbi:3-dehydroquinate dehydratase [Sulfurimonas sp.]|uniref:3-dehydroquinate dehydratase n=1 Tax=Sulfurimonas sp. TaxID=2022749 RepID=UPI0025F6A2A5|nr:3-dehydroquinate dehydratase [Sulfurimonas sp.]MCK9472617.1 3-dehydroquinate dehydratase [Sulfurimonas sp.]MDD3505082.1 3-dehydroquinate dehydratase [Sulfurimonas sp.]
MKFSRGLAALMLTLFFNTLASAQYLYKDELIFNPAFSAEVQKLGSELNQRTGISLRLVMLKKLPQDMNIVEYEKELMKDFSEPTILLTFSEMDSKVDIYANQTSLYEYFDKKQVLSPLSSSVQAFVIALLNMDFSDMSSGGTILPLLAQKTKEGETLGKYAASMFNGYADIAEQIAASKGIVLENAVGSANQISILIVKVLFYSIVAYAIFLYIKRKFYLWRQKDESK